VFDDGTLWTRDNRQLSEPLSGLVQVSSDGALTLLALSDQGVVWGVPSSGDAYDFPGLSNIVQIALGDSGAIALDDQGAVWEVSATALEPIMTDVAQIAAGEGPFVAVKNDGTVWMWGGVISELLTEDMASNPPGDPIQVTW
jgi:alpha-tubulin suppressor-like RCC1 family protein